MKQLTINDLQPTTDYRTVWCNFYNWLCENDGAELSADNIRQVMREIEYKEWGVL